MEIHKPKWHSGNIKTWHILCFSNPPHFLLSLAASPLHPSLSSPGFFNREHICCRNSAEGHVNPPWHSWLSRQTDDQASGLTPLSHGPKGTKIYNWPNLIPRRLNSVRTDQQIQEKLTIQVSYFNPELCSSHTCVSNVGMNYNTSWCWSDSDVVCFFLTNCRKQTEDEIFWV